MSLHLASFKVNRKASSSVEVILASETAMQTEDMGSDDLQET